MAWQLQTHYLTGWTAGRQFEMLLALDVIADKVS